MSSKLKVSSLLYHKSIDYFMSERGEISLLKNKKKIYCQALYVEILGKQLLKNQRSSNNDSCDLGDPMITDTAILSHSLKQFVYILKMEMLRS